MRIFLRDGVGGERGNRMRRLDEIHRRTHHNRRAAGGVWGQLGLNPTTHADRDGWRQLSQGRHLPPNTHCHCQPIGPAPESPGCLAGTSWQRHFSFSWYFTQIHLFDSIRFHICWSGRTRNKCVWSPLSACIYCITIKETLMQTKYIKKTKLLSILCSTKRHLWLTKLWCLTFFLAFIEVFFYSLLNWMCIPSLYLISQHCFACLVTSVEKKITCFLFLFKIVKAERNLSSF